VPVVALALTLPGFAPVATGPAGGTVLSGTFPGTERPGLLYVPPALVPGRRYPVVYLLHGMRGSPAEFVDGTRLLTFADDGIGAGTVRPFFAAMPAAGPSNAYDGEWAGPWEQALVRRIVPWIDRLLPTIRGPQGRVLAGLSAGGFGAVDVGLRHPGLFGTIESWGGYFRPLRDGPFRHASHAALRANDPVLLARLEAPLLRRDRTAFFLSTGPSHSHWFSAGATFAFARELRALGIRAVSLGHPSAQGQWRAQLDRGLAWALRARAAPASWRSGATSATPSPSARGTPCGPGAPRSRAGPTSRSRAPSTRPCRSGSSSATRSPCRC
jgi:S-formylglutathione hydrolase FrmB